MACAINASPPRRRAAPGRARPETDRATPMTPAAMSVAKHVLAHEEDHASRNLKRALGISLLVHLILILGFKFVYPPAHVRDTGQLLEVVLVNAKTKSKPHRADALAQANLDHGGNTDEDRRAKTPLPSVRHTDEGAELSLLRQQMQEARAQAQARLAEQQRLEHEQQRLLTQLKASPTLSGLEAQAPQPSGAEMAHSALTIARMEAQLARQVEEYNKRPRRQFVGARTREYRFAQYVEDWRQKVERIGNLNYPEEARGRLYGMLKLSVSIRSDGSVEKVEIDRSSGHKLLDEAAVRIVHMAAPYAPFPPDVRRDTDVLDVIRTWSFTRTDRWSSD